MEEDTGKSLHVGGATGRIHGAEYSLLDYNRAGVPLIEIVTKTIAGTGERAPEVARAYVTALRDLLRALGRLRRADGPGLAALRRERVADGRRAPTEFGTRTETKNVNSLRSVERAVRYEMTRQARCWPAAARSSRRPGTSRRPTAPPRRAGPRRPPRTTGTSRSPTWCRSRRRASGSSELRGTLPEMPCASGASGSRRSGQLSDAELRDLLNAGAVDLVAATVDAGATPGRGPRLVGRLPGAAGQHPRGRAGRAADHPGAGGAR